MKKKKLTTSKVICSKCKTPKKTQKKQMERLIGAFGSIEAVHEKYHCIKCRKEYNVRRDGRPKPIIKKREPKKDYTQSSFLKTFVVDRKTTPTSNEELKSVGACWRPDLWIKNKKYCDGCPHYEISCGCKNSKLKKKRKE